MNTPHVKRSFRTVALRTAIVGLSLSVLLASCATVVPAPAGVEPERFLPSGALAYARLDQPTLAAALARLPGRPGPEDSCRSRGRTRLGTPRL